MTTTVETPGTAETAPTKPSAAERPLAVSCGEPSGIGPDVILKAWAARRARNLPAFLVLGDPEQLATRAARLGLDVAIAACEPAEASEVFDAHLPVVPLASHLAESPGRPDPANATGVIEAIGRAVALTMDGAARAIVTAPIAKKPLYDAGFAHPGHTEYLAHLATRATGRPVHPVMMIAGPSLRTVPVTIHLPLADVPAALTTDLIASTIRIVDADLKTRFGIATPRIAVAGLNPHAGEAGALGMAEIEVIAPAIAQARADDIAVTGPLPADTMFHASARASYDVAICMYHDQALIPAKAFDFDEAVNVTLGLPFVRTSPDHGTALAIAGTGAARPDSFIAALTMADRMARS